MLTANSGMTFSAFQGCLSLATPTTTTTIAGIQQINPYYVLEPYIAVAWDSSDLKLFTPTSAPLSVSVLQQCQRRTSGKSIVPVSSAGSAGVPGTSVGKDMPNAPAGLSTAAKAGIGVAVPVAVISAIVMIVLLLKYRRKAHASAEELKRRDQSDTLELKNGIGVVVSEGDADSRAEADFENGRAEADSISIRPELDSPVVKAEADGSSLKYELDSGWHGHEKGNG